MRSDDTAATDRIENLIDHAALPSLSCYVLLEQTLVGATLLTREPNSPWTAAHTPMVPGPAGHRRRVALAALYQGLTSPAWAHGSLAIEPNQPTMAHGPPNPLIPPMTDLSPLIASPGASSLPYFDPAFPDRQLILHAARPTAWHPGLPILFVHHGVARNGRDYRDYWLPHVDAANILAIAIEFPEATFPQYLWYNFGNLHTADGTPNPREQWTFGIDDRLFQALQHQGITTTQRYGLFGHSAGGQYVHRMLSFGYRDHVAVAVSANAGTYAMPDLAVDWPWGLGATDVTTDALPALLAFPLTVMAGTADIKTTGRFFPKGPKSLKQGPTRHARAHTYLRVGQEAASRLGVPLAWRVIDVPDVGHDGRRMFDAAVPLIAEALHRGV